MCVTCQSLYDVVVLSGCRRLLTLDSTAANLSNVVDLYNSATGAWSTAQLSVARDNLAATSVGSVALFAGGYTGSVLSLGKGGLLLMGACELHARAL